MNKYKLDAIKIGKRVKEIRKDNGLTQTEFGERIAASLSTIANIESGRNKDIEQKKSLFKLISKTFNCNEEWLLYGIGVKKTNGYLGLIETLSDEMNLSPKAKKMLETFLTLDPDKQDALYDFVNALASNLN